jgi:hypothetical protein
MIILYMMKPILALRDLRPSGREIDRLTICNIILTPLSLQEDKISREQMRTF